MECPRCGNTDLRVLRTRIFGEGKTRVRECVSNPEGGSLGCGLIFKTMESIEEVQVFNPNTVAAEMVDVRNYKENHLKKELEGLSGFQQRMFK